jgi:hypothetical protein
MVSQRWKELDTEGKAFYKQVAAKDLERYRRELNEMESGTGNINNNKQREAPTAVLTARSA